MGRGRLKRKQEKAQRHAQPKPPHAAVAGTTPVVPKRPGGEREVGRAGGTPCGATRVHACAGCRGLGDRPLESLPARAAVRGDDRARLRHEADSGRRARALRGRATSTCSRCAGHTAETRPAARTSGRGRQADPSRAGRGAEFGADRPRPKRHRHANRAWRCALVAVHGSLRAGSRLGLTGVSSRRPECCRAVPLRTR
jgi:hypothetical protein